MKWFLQSSVTEIFRRKSFSCILLPDYRFLWLQATIREVAKPEDTPFHGKTDGWFVISLPTYPQKENVFPLYTSFINPWMNVKESAGFLPFEFAPFEFVP